MSIPTRAEIFERWCDDLPSLAVSSVAGALGRTFGDVALAIGDLDLALTWARALAPFAFPSRASALAAIAARLYDTRHVARSHELVSEAIDAIHFEGDAIEILTLHGGVLAWEVEDALVALVSTDDELAFAAVQWMYHARIGEQGADRARQQVLAAASRLAGATLAVQRAAIAAAFSTDDVDLIADHVSIVATRDLVEAHVRAGNITAALATQPTTAHWLFSYLARTRRDDPRAEQWAAHARRLAAQLTECFEEGLLTSMEAFEGRLEVIALRAAEDPRGAREALMEVVHEEVSHGRECMADVRQLCVDVGSGVRSPGLEAEPKWRTARGERQLARALEAWRRPADLEGRVRGVHHARTIFRAATSFALDGDLRRARGLIERGLAGEPALVSRIELVQSALVRAWIATDQVQQAVELAFATSLSVAALAPLAVELATNGKPDIALQLLELGLCRVRSSSELVLLARGLLAIANDREAARMLDALDQADRALDAVLRW